MNALERLKAWAESAGIGDSMTWVGKDYSIAQAKHDAVEVMRALSDSVHDVAIVEAKAEAYAREMERHAAYAEQLAKAAEDAVREMGHAAETLTTYSPWGSGALDNVAERLARAINARPEIRRDDPDRDMDTQAGLEVMQDYARSKGRL